MKTCPRCHAANSEFKQYCVHCGAPLPKETSSGGYTYGLGNGKDDISSGTGLGTSSRTISFKEAIHICLKDKYATFTGRARRSEFWKFCLFAFITTLIVCGICALLAWIIPFREPDAVKVITLIGALAVFLLLLSPALAVMIRRLHDTGKSGWWSILIAIPVANIVVIIFTLLPSDPHDNKYGKRP